MKKLVVFIVFIHLCLFINAQVAGKTIPVTTSSKKALAFYNEAMNAYQDVDLTKFSQLTNKAIVEDPDFFMANYQNAMFAAYLKQEKNFIKFATAAVNSKTKISSGEKILKDVVKLLLEDRKSDLTGFGKKLVEMFPDDVNSYLQLMTYQYLIKDFDGQISTLNNALKLHGRKDFLYNVLAYAHMEKGQFKEAETALDTYIGLSPQLPNPYDSKGDLYMRTKEYAKAYENYMKAHSIDTAWGKGKALKAKTLAENAPDKKLDQVELMKKFIGTWQSGNGKDTINFFELHEYNNALLQINSRIINGMKRMLVTCTYTYDPASENFKSFALWPGGQLQTWRMKFTSDKEAEFARVQDMKTNTVMYRNTVTLDNPDQMSGINYNSENVKIGTSKWVRTSASLPVKKSDNVDQLALMQVLAGKWRSDIGKDTADFSEWQRFGNAFTNITYRVIKGEKSVRYTQNVVYSPTEGRFRSFVTYANGNYLTYLAAFNSEKKWVGNFVTDFNPEIPDAKLMNITYFTNEISDPKLMNITYFTKDGVKTREIKWYKVE